MRRKREQTYCNFHLFTSSWLVFNCSLYHVTSPSLLTFKPEMSLYFHLVSEGETYLFLVIPHLHRRFRTSSFFYHSHSTVISWPMSALAWILRGHLTVHKVSVCFSSSYFFLLSFHPQKLAFHSLYNLDLPLAIQSCYTRRRKTQNSNLLNST